MPMVSGVRLDTPRRHASRGAVGRSAEAHHLAGGMNPRVGTACGDDPHAFVGHLADGILQRILDVLAAWAWLWKP